MNPIARTARTAARTTAAAARRAGRSVKAAALATVLRFAGSRGWSWLRVPGTSYDYVRAVGDGRSNAVVAACINWIATTFPEAPVQVLARDADGGLSEQPDSPYLALLERPNTYYSGEHLWAATLADRELTGNAYWLKVRSALGRVVELWWVPSTLIEPQWPLDGSAFISHYAYMPNGVGVPIVIDPADIVHFRVGFDPDNIRKGLSPLRALLREIASDNEAANWTASLLRNMGVPGVLIAPDASVELDEDDAAEIKANYQQRTTGDRRGEAIVMSAPTKVTPLAFNPQQMELTALRRVPEERITAVIGVPAIVAGIGIGLQRCLPADARVWTTQGAVRIADVPAGAVVWSYVDGRLEPRRVVRQWRTGYRRLYELRTRNRVIRATDNHPFLVRVPGTGKRGANADRHATVEWKMLRDIRSGDRIVQPNALPDQGGTLLPDGSAATPALLQFLGAVVGDGTVSPGVGVRVAMPPADRCHAAYRALAADLFTKYLAGGQRPWKRAQDGKTERIVAGIGAGQSYNALGRELGLSGASIRDRYLHVTQPKPVERGPVALQERPRDFGFSSAQASTWLAELGFAGRAHTKRVPSWVYGLSRELRLTFLAGLVDSDGSIDRRGCLTFGFCNEALTHDVRDLLISVGIQCSNVYHRTMGPEVLPNPGSRTVYHAFTFTASSAVQIAAIPFVDALYRERVVANALRLRETRFDAKRAGLAADLGFYSVRSITEVASDDVYDIEVEGGHSFIADGVLVHNSTFSNFREAREAAYESKIVPTQRLMLAEVNSQLTPDFGDPKRLRVAFDLSQVRALQDDQNALHQRAREDLVAGLITRNEALALIGEPPEEGSDVLYLPATIAPVPVTDVLGLRLGAARVTVADIAASATGLQPAAEAPGGGTTDAATEPGKGRRVARMAAKAPEPSEAASRASGAVRAVFSEALAEAVLAVLADEHAGLSDAEHAALVLGEARQLAVTERRNGRH